MMERQKRERLGRKTEKRELEEGKTEEKKNYNRKVE